MNLRNCAHIRVDQQEAASGRVDGGRIWGLKCPCAEDTSSVSWRENRSHKDSRGRSTRPVQTGILRSLGTWARPLLLYLSRLSGREEMRGHWRAWFIAWYKWHSVSLYLLPMEVGSASWWVCCGKCPMLTSECSLREVHWINYAQRDSNKILTMRCLSSVESCLWQMT